MTARVCTAVSQTYIHTMDANIRSRFAKRQSLFVSNISLVFLNREDGSEKLPTALRVSCSRAQTSCKLDLVVNYSNYGPQTLGTALSSLDTPLKALSRMSVIGNWGDLSPLSRMFVVYHIVEMSHVSPPACIMSLLRELVMLTPTCPGYHERTRRDYLKETRCREKYRWITFPFSAHVDYSQNSEFIEQVKAQRVVNAAMRILKSKSTPRNLETLELSFRGERVAKVTPQGGDIVSGLLVLKDYSYTLLDPHDLRDFAGLSTIVTQRQRTYFGVGWDLIRWHLEGMYGTVEEGLDNDGVRTMRVRFISVKMICYGCGGREAGELTLEWDSSASNDMIADSTLALITGTDKSPTAVPVKLTTQSCSHAHAHADSHSEPSYTRIQRLAWFLEAHFGEVELHMPDETNQHEQEHELEGDVVTSANEALRRRVEAVLDMAVSTVSPLAESFQSGTSALQEDAGVGKDG
ncbi:Pre-mRNA 3'-end-processing endonuclease polyadenylation factor C-term-domain-containing protein [Melanogaster broomeanus]|nr:Pre-mRNA 3'-end-processing endonuclease polyadenylation factor C-term-domain-containing protein [Melanogaster broomeanus]